ncbi:hypothetical protein ADK38_26720 [Streptomyces varsoviensis]|uniref:Uncharacterized protein n=1 Tax=Streptomyces varsoviensis TaxID=67373 RepID=A0ABR5J1E5_9ACTN|nr:hypothetical protein ADK38_26720 [Streptomyces varsoviensis]
MPSASAPNALQRPSAESPPCSANSWNTTGVDITAAPPASARSDSPARSAWAAMCTVVSEDEQAVSTVNAGPSRPNS